MKPKHTEITNVNGVIDGKKLLRILGVIPASDRIKAVLSPSEPITTLSPAGEDLKELVNRLRSQAEKMKKYSPALYLIFELQLNSGCRISEVLDIRPGDIMINGNVRIRGKKGSSNRIISGGKAVDYLLKCKSNSVYPFRDFNRKFVWSIYKKFGIEIEVNSSGKKAVTHSLRHVMVSMSKQIEMPLTETAQYIGHKNKENTRKYGGIRKK